MADTGKRIGQPVSLVKSNTPLLAAYKLHLILAFISLLVLTAGYFIYNSQQDFLRREAEDEITAVAQLKASEISRWRSDWLAYADSLSANSFYPGWITQWKASPTPELQGTMKSRLTSEARRHSYLDLLLIDTGGEVLNSLNSSSSVIDKAMLEQLAIAFRDHRSVMTDLYIDGSSNKPHIDIITPFFTDQGNGEEGVGAIVMCIDPAQFLYPLIQSWPVPSRTAEILLVERQGDRAVFLNNPRFQPDSAIKLSVPLAEKENIAVKAVTGGEGVVDGPDYRGEPVLAALQQVEGSDWSIIAKIDAAEELSAWQWQSGLIIAAFITLLAAVLAVIGLFWQRGQRIAIQALYKAESDLSEAETRFRSIIEHSGDVFYMFDLQAKPLYLSPRSYDIVGYTPEEFNSIRWIDLLTANPVNKAAIKITLEAIKTGRKQPPYPIELVTKSGTIITVELNESPLKDAGGKVIGLAGVMRNITERNKAEQALIESEARVRAKLDAILSPVGDIGAMELADIVDTAAIQSMMDDFYKLTNMGIAILDLKGNVLVATGWQDICTQFHRIHPETCKNCIESDTLLSRGVAEGTHKVYKCKNNMWDIATPVMVGDKHVGNLFLGQFLFDNESPGYEFFRSQARRYGFNEEAYIAALERVPRWSGETVDTVMAFYAKLARLVSVLSHNNLMLARTLTDNDRTMSALKDSEEKFRAIAERSADVVFLTDSLGTIIFISAAAETVFGCKPAEMSGRHFMEFLAPGDIETAIDAFADSIEKGSTAKMLELQMKRKDGSLFFGELRSAVVHLADFTGRAGIIRDVTERKQAETEIRGSEERFSAAFKINPDPTAVTEIDTGKIIDVNPAYEKWTGYERSELIGRSTRELNLWVDPADRDRFIRILKEKHEFEDMHISFRVRNGEVRQTWFSARTIEIGGKPYLFTRAHDVTEYIRMQSAIEESEEKYRLLVENALEAIVIAENGVLKFANHQATMLSGYQQEEFIDKPIIGFIHPDDRRTINEHFRQQLKGADVSNIYVFRFICKSGDVKWVETSVARITWEGRPATLNFLADVTDRRRLEEEQQRVARLESVGLLAGGIAHDFNNILTAILGNISLAKTESVPGSELRDSLEQAEKASQRAKHLTQQLLTFSRGGTPVKKLARLADLLTDTAGFALHGSNVKCTFTIPPDLWDAEIDEGQVSQVIHNLVINAQQAMPNGGTIELSAENMAIDITQRIGKGLPLKEGNYVRILVEDHGSGIPAEHVARIFDPFFTTRQKGSGLGLATSFSIARNHGGHLSVESEPGYGSTFYFYLPASTETLTHEQVMKEAIGPMAGARILLMDDEEGVRMVAGRMLRHLGYPDIEFATKGEEAIKLYKAAMESGKPFSAVILDLTIAGGMGGIETARKLLEVDPGVKAVVSSGYADGTVMAEYKEYGFSGMVAKPYTLEELGKTLNAMMG